jgi:hypothetical protein
MWMWLVPSRLDFFTAFWLKRKRDKEASIIAERAARVERCKAAKARGGVTMDGYNYFFTVAELDAWAAEQRDKLRALVESLKVCCAVLCRPPVIAAVVCTHLFSVACVDADRGAAAIPP